MGKPGDPHDVTQPLSESQVVAVTSSPPPIAANDQSVAWKGTVVSADEFAPGKPRSSRAKWIVIGVLGAGAIGLGAYELVPRSNPEPAKLAPAAIPADAAAAAPAAIPVDAGAPPDAMPPVDAALPPPAVVPAKATTKKQKPRRRGR